MVSMALHLRVKHLTLRVKHLTLRVKHLTLRVKHLTLRVKQCFMTPMAYHMLMVGVCIQHALRHYAPIEASEWSSMVARPTKIQLQKSNLEITTD